MSNLDFQKRHTRTKGSFAYLPRYTLAEFLHDMSVAPYYRNGDGRDGRSSWCGDVSYQDALNGPSMGHKSALDRAMRLIDEMDTGGFLTTGRSHWESAIVGAIPHVPHAIIGVPDAMLACVEAPRLGPIEIVVDVCCSAEISTRAMETRGAAILAYVLALSAVRPVSLSICSSLDGSKLLADPTISGRTGISSPVISLGTTPLDLTSASYVLAHVGFMRHLMMGMASRDTNYSGRWGWGSNGISAEAVRLAREALGLVPDDLYIPPGHASDQLIGHPEAWLRAKLEEAQKQFGRDD